MHFGLYQVRVFSTMDSNQIHPLTHSPSLSLSLSLSLSPSLSLCVCVCVFVYVCMLDLIWLTRIEIDFAYMSTLRRFWKRHKHSLKPKLFESPYWSDAPPFDQHQDVQGGTKSHLPCWPRTPCQCSPRLCSFLQQPGHLWETNGFIMKSSFIGECGWCFP